MASSTAIVSKGHLLVDDRLRIEQNGPILLYAANELGAIAVVLAHACRYLQVHRLVARLHYRRVNLIGLFDEAAFLFGLLILEVGWLLDWLHFSLPPLSVERRQLLIDFWLAQPHSAAKLAGLEHLQDNILRRRFRLLVVVKCHVGIAVQLVARVADVAVLNSFVWVVQVLVRLDEAFVQ